MLPIYCHYHFFPHTALILGPRRKSEDNLKFNDEGSELNTFRRREERKASHLDRTGSDVGKLAKEARKDCWQVASWCSVTTADPQDVIFSQAMGS